jgi:hypothetical protein
MSDSITLIGMPRVDQRFRHYPQLYTRHGFSHHYRALGRDELLFVPTATGNASAAPSTPTTSPTPKPSP